MRKLFFSFSLFFLGFLAFSEGINFKNLGFSENSRYFMFGEYGLENHIYYSKVYFVDVFKNEFTNPGVYGRNFKKYIDNTDTSDKVLYELLKIISYRIKDLKINHLNKGRSIYIYVEEVDNDPGTSLNFIDFKTENQYKVSLNKEKKVSSSAFYIDFSVEDSSGSVIRKTKIGREKYFRKNVIDYKIKEIILFPKEDGIVFVVEKKFLDLSGREFERFMVEVRKY